MSNGIRNEEHAEYNAMGEEECLAKTLFTADEQEIIDAAKAVIRRKFRRGAVLTDPASAIQYLILHLAGRRNEVFGMVWLDTRHRVIATEYLFEGTIDGASVYPRVVVQSAMHHNASACILFHNHPSGEPEPSRADVRITGRLRDALALLDVRILDHLVISGDRHVSLAERGLL